MSFNSVTMSQLGVQGERTKGADVRQQNIMAAMSIANIVKSSLGPVGLDKMMVDDVSMAAEIKRIDGKSIAAVT